MIKFEIKRKKVAVGAAPGTLIYTGSATETSAEIQLIKYNPDHISQSVAHEFAGVMETTGDGDINWININAINDTTLISEIGNQFNLHPLLLEAILNTHQLPKFECFDNCFFFTLKMLSLENEESPIRHEHISFVLTSNFLLSFQERPGDVFEPVRNRLQSGKGRLRHRKTDYLLYTLIDVVVDNYFSIVNKLTDKVAALEEQLLEDDSPHIVQEIVTQSKQLLYLRRAILPLREAIRTLLKEEDDLIEEPTIAFFNNVLDNLQQVASDLEMSREMLSGLMNLHQSNLSNRMNEVMKTLTIIATIFIPLTFVAGIYGMNFQYMPELGWEYSYPIAIGFMALLGIVMFIYMKRKNWF